MTNGFVLRNRLTGHPNPDDRDAWHDATTMMNAVQRTTRPVLRISLTPLIVRSATSQPNTTYSVSVPMVCFRSAARNDKTGVVGRYRSLHSVAGVELHEDATDMGLHCGLGHKYCVADLSVREAAGNQFEDVALTVG